MTIPKRMTNPPVDKEKRFYVVAPASVHLDLQREATERGSDLWTLGGIVLSEWLRAGCPDFNPNSESVPAPSSSPIAGQQEDDQ